MRETIFALIDGNRGPRYVGRTAITDLDRKLAQLRAQRNSDSPVSRWLRTAPSVAIIHVETLPHGDRREGNTRRKYWICRYADEGHDLLNIKRS